MKRQTIVCCKPEVLLRLTGMSGPCFCFPLQKSLQCHHQIGCKQIVYVSFKSLYLKKQHLFLNFIYHLIKAWNTTVLYIIFYVKNFTSLFILYNYSAILSKMYTSIGQGMLFINLMILNALHNRRSLKKK